MWLLLALTSPSVPIQNVLYDFSTSGFAKDEKRVIMVPMKKAGWLEADPQSVVVANTDCRSLPIQVKLAFGKRLYGRIKAWHLHTAPAVIQCIAGFRVEFNPKMDCHYHAHDR